VNERWIDPRPAFAYLSGYPAWVQRRLERLNKRYVSQQGMTNPERVQEKYSRLGRGSGARILPCHLEWFARAWLVAGPHLPAPSTACVPDIVNALSLLQIEPPLLGDWLFELAADEARLHGWQSLDASKISGGFLREKCLRRYWEWLMGVVGSHRPDDLVLSAFETEVLASRVIRWLFKGVGLRGLCSRSMSWQRAPPKVLNPLPKVSADSWLPLLDDRTGDVLDGAWVCHLGHQESLEIEGREQRNCVGRYWGDVLGRTFLAFSIWDPEEDLRATLVLVHDIKQGWRIHQLRGPGNTRVKPGTRVPHVADKICRILDELGDEHPLIAEYISPSSSFAFWRRMGSEATHSRQLGHYIPRVGRAYPEATLRQGWTDVRARAASHDLFAARVQQS
jgi:hypothetical protein